MERELDTGEVLQKNFKTMTIGEGVTQRRVRRNCVSTGRVTAGRVFVLSVRPARGRRHDWCRGDQMPGPALSIHLWKSCRRDWHPSATTREPRLRAVHVDRAA